LHERWSAWGYEPVGSTPERFRGKIRGQTSRGTPKVIRDSGIPCRIDRDRAGAPRGSLSERFVQHPRKPTPAFLIWISITGAAFA